MAPFDFRAAGIAIREDLSASFARAWERLAAPGTWWSGPERVALAAATRAAASCALCRRRKEALSPRAVGGAHDPAPSPAPLPEAAVDAVHRIATDPARLTRAWLETLHAAGLPDTHYVEALGVAVQVLSVDAFHRALGLALEPLPPPRPGEPSRRRPAGALPEDAWVPMIREDRATGPESDLYGGRRRTGNVLRALSLVPAELRGVKDLSAAMYLSEDEMGRFVHPHRALDRAQIELVAGRVSALRECFY